MNTCLLYRGLPLLFALALLTGCAALTGAATSPATADAGNSVASPALSSALSPANDGSAAALLIYFETLRKLSPVELARATDLARKRYVTEKTVVRQMQYALTLAIPGGDAEYAQQLLGPLARESQQNRELRGLAVLLSVDLAERQRLNENLQAQTRRADELQRQLEALKNVEKHLLQRDVPGAVKP